MSGRLRFETRAIHDGQPPDPTTGAVIVPIYQTSTYAQESPGRHRGYDYSRTANPTRTALEVALASLEEGAHGLAFASGMAAISAVTSLLNPGDHVIAPDDVYGGTYRLLVRVLERYGLGSSFVDMTRPEQVEAAMRPQTRLVLIETPTNPYLKILDIAALSTIARAHGALVAVDNTFASPYGQQPLRWGADLVVHSTTKYLGGHSDVGGGAVVVDSDDLHATLKFHQNAVGAVPGPSTAGWCYAASRRWRSGCGSTRPTRRRWPDSWHPTRRWKRCSIRGCPIIPATRWPRGR